MMLPHGAISENKNCKPYHPDEILGANQAREARGRELTEDHLQQEETKDSVVLAKDSSSIASVEKQNSDLLNQDLKNDQILSIASRIEVLKSNYSKETDLIILLESYLDDYKETQNSWTFAEWVSDLILEQEHTITSKQYGYDSCNPGDLEIEESILNLLLIDRQIIDILLSPSLSLEAVTEAHKLYCEVRSSHIASKSAFENEKKYFEQHVQHAKFIEQYNTAEINYTNSKKDYHNTIYGPKFPPISTYEIKNLYYAGLQNKRIFETYKEYLAVTYRSLERAKELEQVYQKASEIMEKSGLFFTEKAKMSEEILKKGSEDQQIPNRNFVTIFDHLAHDHLALVTATIEKNQVMIDHLVKRISLLKEAKSASQKQLNTFRDLSQNKANEYCQKSLPLFQESIDSFLSAYHLLKYQHPSSPCEASQALSDRGLHLKNTALVFQIPPIAPEQKTPYPSEKLAIIEAARMNAEQVIQEKTDVTKRLYHAKITHFLYEKLSVFNEMFEIKSLKENVNNERSKRLALEWKHQHENEASRYKKLDDQLQKGAQLDEQKRQKLEERIAAERQELDKSINKEREALMHQPPPILLAYLEEAVKHFEESINFFDRLSQLSQYELNSNEVPVMVKTAFESKTKGNNLIRNIKNLMFPD